MKELPTSPPNGRRPNASGQSEKYKVIGFTPLALYLKLGQLLSNKAIKDRGHEEGLTYVIETILDTIICLPELDVGHSSPCPFHHMAQILETDETDEYVKHIIVELQHCARELILDTLSQGELDYIVDIKIQSCNHMYLIGGRTDERY